MFIMVQMFSLTPIISNPVITILMMMINGCNDSNIQSDSIVQIAEKTRNIAVGKKKGNMPYLEMRIFFFGPTSMFLWL